METTDAAELLRRVWIAAGGFEHSFPVGPDCERQVLALVTQLRIVAQSVPNPLGVLAREMR